ncbi:unnamed protein product [Acanthoscelides obtectus]|uniref:Uncharacterized protein n=1 Tax=Acanthoscelides obtectus TaxID=200917 RepID=A0A9P0M6L3_ACAOB|nr:unnamed protein product [Acanthoscelides obtectus]CAK1624688.1 hypothetical protein AOBTE_LOCUS2700 [Acanthoscelides obtectus]
MYAKSCSRLQLPGIRAYGFMILLDIPKALSPTMTCSTGVVVPGRGFGPAKLIQQRWKTARDAYFRTKNAMKKHLLEVLHQSTKSV